MAIVIYCVSLCLVAVYRLSPCDRSLHFAIWSTMGNLTTHAWLTALHHQLIDRAVSLLLLLTKPKWCRNQPDLFSNRLFFFSLMFSYFLSHTHTHFKCCYGHESYGLLWNHTSRLTNQRLVQPAHTIVILCDLPSQLHSYTFCAAQLSLVEAPLVWG